MSLAGNKKTKWLAASAMFLLVMGYMLYCAAPGLQWGDSAEMVAVSCDMGVAHSPGYPLYSMVSRMFSWLPLEPYAFRLNVMSVFLGALSVAMLSMLAAMLAGGSLYAGLIAAAGVMGCRAFVEYGLYTEVYALHMVLFSAVLLLVAGYRENGKWSYLACALFVAGLGVAHHFMMLTVLIGLLLYMMMLPGHTWRVAAGPPLLVLGWGVAQLFTAHDTAMNTVLYVKIGLGAMAAAYVAYVVALALTKRMPRGAAPAAIGALVAPAVALLLFGYMPLASARNPVSDWWAPETARNFFSLVMLQGYSSTFPAGPAEWLQRLNIMGMLLQMPVLVLVVSIAGIVFVLRTKTREGLFLLLLVLGTFAGSLFVKHGKPDALRLPLYALMFLSAGVGAEAFFQWRVFKGAAWRKGLKWVCVVFVIFAALFNLSDSDWRFMNRSGAAYEFGARILDGARADSILFIGTQSPSIMGYFEACEPQRMAAKHIKIIPVSFLLFDWKLDQLHEKYPELYFPELPETPAEKPVFRIDDPARAHYAMKLLSENRTDAAVYSDFQFMSEDQGWRTIPDGVLYRLVPDSTPTEWVDEMMEADESPEWEGVSFRDTTTAANIASVHNERGKVFLDKALLSGDENLLRKAEKEFNRAIEIADESLDQFGRALSMEKKPLDWGSEMLEDDEAADSAGAPPKQLQDVLTMMEPTIGDAPPGEEEDPIPIFYGEAAELLNVKAEAMSNKGHCRVFYGQPLKGLQLVKSALLMAPMNPRLYQSLAMMFFRLKDGNPEYSTYAIALWHASIALDPGNARAYHNIGSAMVGMQQRDAAVGYYKKALEIDPLYKSAYVNLGRVYNRMDNNMAAILTLEKAQELFPRDLELRCELAQEYGDAGMIHLVEDAVRGIISTFEPDEEMFYCLAIVFRNGMQIKNMARAAQELKKIDPGFPLRRLFASYQNCDRVFPILEGLIEEMPNEPDLRLELSLRTGQCGDEEKAIEIMEGIVRDYPDNEGAKKLLERFKTPEDQIMRMDAFPGAPE